MFSHEQPKEETIQSAKFSTYILGEGWSQKIENGDDNYAAPIDKTMMCKVNGTNPGYGATCTALTLSAFIILTEKENLPKRYFFLV